MADDHEVNDGKKPKPLSDKTAEDAINHIIHGVGYGRPPADKQFKKGQSGNPKGRPRGAAADISLNDQAILKAALAKSREMISVRSGNGVKQITVAQAMVESVAAHGLKGNARSQGLWIDLTRSAEIANAREIKEWNERWSDYKSRASALIALAAKNGDPDPDILPHPDDIIIDSDTGPRFLGPMDEAGKAELEHTIKLCEVLMMQDELDRRSDKCLDGSPLTEPGTARYLFRTLDETLPPRLRHSHSAIIGMMFDFEGLTKRDLQKELFAAWRKLGRRVPRGFVFGNMSDEIPPFAAQHELLRMVVSGEVNIEDSSPEEVMDIIQEHHARRRPELKSLISSMIAQQKAEREALPRNRR